MPQVLKMTHTILLLTFVDFDNRFADKCCFFHIKMQRQPTRLTLQNERLPFSFFRTFLVLVT